MLLLSTQLSHSGSLGWRAAWGLVNVCFFLTKRFFFFSDHNDLDIGLVLESDPLPKCKGLI